MVTTRSSENSSSPFSPFCFFYSNFLFKNKILIDWLVLKKNMLIWCWWISEFIDSYNWVIDFDFGFDFLFTFCFWVVKKKIRNQDNVWFVITIPNYKKIEAMVRFWLTPFSLFYLLFFNFFTYCNNGSVNGLNNRSKSSFFFWIINIDWNFGTKKNYGVFWRRNDNFWLEINEIWNEIHSNWICELLKFMNKIVEVIDIYMLNLELLIKYDIVF